METKKVKLNEIKVESFVTSLDTKQKQTFVGGATPTVIVGGVIGNVVTAFLTDIIVKETRGIIATSVDLTGQITSFNPQMCDNAGGTGGSIIVGTTNVNSPCRHQTLNTGGNGSL